MTQIRNNLYYGFMLLVVILTSLPSDVVNIIPPKHKPYVLGVVAAASWIKGHRNLFQNPDGTSAKVAYIPEADQK